MTRLKEKDIDYVSDNMFNLDKELQKICGKSLREIAARASGKSVEMLYDLKIGVVPITSGLGIIGGFSETVCSILQYLGAKAYVTDKADVAGIGESLAQGKATIMADDDAFIAVNHRNNLVGENGDATGRGFAAALLLAASDLKGKEVLVAGAGPVGRAAAKFLADNGAKVLIYDIDENKLADLPYEKLNSLEGRRFDYIIEATPGENVITRENVTEKTIISAPGVPLGVEKGLAEELQKSFRLIHNPLELGTAVMYTDIL